MTIAMARTGLIQRENPGRSVEKPRSLPKGIVLQLATKGHNGKRTAEKGRKTIPNRPNSKKILNPGFAGLLFQTTFAVLISKGFIN